MKTYYINFEKQGYEVITIKVDAKNLEDAYNKACRAYVESDGAEYSEVTKKQLPCLDCMLIDGGSGEELDPEDGEDDEDDDV